jgi:hypothetical protein
MRKKTCYFLLAGSFLLLTPHAQGAPYTAATVADLTADLGKVAAGDTIFVRAGAYSITAKISISVSGSAAKRICLMAYPGDQRPTLDFSGMSVASGNRGVILSGSYWYIKGIIIKGAGDNGMNISGSNNIIEFCDFTENRDSGCQLGGGASNNQIINCDSYYNLDPPDEGDADGFSPKMDVGSGNTFKGCRSWQNSDDGWDGYLRGADNVSTRLEDCWCFKNGYRKDGSASSGNGNGFKMGGSDSKDLKHNFTLVRCLSFQNRVKGFDQNSNRGSITLYNCTGFNNGTNYAIDGGSSTLTAINCIAAGSGSSSLKGGTQTTNNLNAATSNFTSVDPVSAMAPRKADGSLPDIGFMHLASGSSLIDAGTVISGVTYEGSKPDLGCFETGTTVSTAVSHSSAPAAYFAFLTRSDGSITITATTRQRESGNISLFTLSGKKVMDAGAGPVLFEPGATQRHVDLIRRAAGKYVCKASCGNSESYQRIINPVPCR